MGMRVVLLAVASLLTSVGCGGAEMHETTMQDGTLHSNDPATAVVAAAVGAVTWGVVGCHANGCNPGYQCSDESDLCEPVPCGGECPLHTHCDPVTDVCLADP